MKKSLLPSSLFLALAFPVCAATYSTDATVSGVLNTDWNVLKEQPAGTIVFDPTGNVITALQGTAAAPGGNVELFIASEQPPFVPDMTQTGAFANAPHIVLSGTAGGTPFAISSLNGADWFTTSISTYSTVFTAPNLANKWFNDFLTLEFIPAMNPAFVPALLGNQAAIFDAFRNGGGFAQLSDPNISYLYQDTTDIKFGMAGFIDLSPRLRALLTNQGLAALVPLVPDGLQASEVAFYNGVPQYSFNATPSGVQMLDPLESYTGEYAFSIPIPEPSAFMMLALGTLALTRRRLASAAR